MNRVLWMKILISIVKILFSFLLFELQSPIPHLSPKIGSIPVVILRLEMFVPVVVKGKRQKTSVLSPLTSYLVLETSDLFFSHTHTRTSLRFIMIKTES